MALRGAERVRYRVHVPVNMTRVVLDAYSDFLSYLRSG